MKKILKNHKDDWKEAFSQTLWNSIASLIPIILGVFLYVLFKQKPTFKSFTNNGEFAIYSATMIATSLYIVFKDYKTVPFRFRKLCGGVSILVLLLSSILYFSVTTVDTINVYIDYDREFMRVTSFYIYVFSVFFTFILNGMDKSRTTIDIQNKRKEDLEKLESNFDNLGD